VTDAHAGDEPPDGGADPIEPLTHAVLWEALLAGFETIGPEGSEAFLYAFRDVASRALAIHRSEPPRGLHSVAWLVVQAADFVADPPDPD